MTHEPEASPGRQTAAAPAPQAPDSEPSLEIDAMTDVGTEREHNEDHCGHAWFGPATAVVAVADGVSSYEAGETASQKAVEVVLRAFAEQPAAKATGKRLAAAVQQANIEVYDMAIVVPELRGMATTLTAVVVDGDELHAAHVGDSRLYLVRGSTITQLTKDHTVAAERRRMGLLRADRAREHPDRFTLTRSVGRELIVAMDRLSARVFRDDVLVVCSDGLYNVLEDQEIAAEVRDASAPDACRALIEAANRRGTADNLTAGVIRVRGAGPAAPPPPQPTLRDRLRRLVGRR